MAYNFDKNTCDKCGITEEDISNKVNNAMTYSERMHQGSFNLGQDESVLCPGCQKEKILSEILDKEIKND
jgi:hypothetical protein